MRLQTITTTCDAPGCTEEHESDQTGDTLAASGWTHDPQGDYCPTHAPNAYWCGRCGAGHQTLDEFDTHIETCRPDALNEP